MQRLGALVIVLFTLWAECRAINFCEIPACEGKPHLGCGNDMTFESICMRTRVLLNMQIYRDYLVKIHNKYREVVASGEIKGLSRASRMPELLWHSKLALIADYHVKLCRFEMDQCVAVSTFAHPALNYGMNWVDFDATAVHSISTNSEKLTFQAELWMHQVYRLASDENPGSEFHEITNILNDNNRYVGCAAAEDFNRLSSRFVLVCYYENQKDPESPIYANGTFSEGNCPNGGSEEFPHLCTTLPDKFD